jgi:hypothetical protein
VNPPCQYLLCLTQPPNASVSASTCVYLSTSATAKHHSIVSTCTPDRERERNPTQTQPTLSHHESTPRNMSQYEQTQPNPTQLISTQLISTQLISSQRNATQLISTQLNQGTPHTPAPARLPARSPALFTEYSADIRAAGSPWGMGHGHGHGHGALDKGEGEDAAPFAGSLASALFI